jgi:hypothetical protein
MTTYKTITEDLGFESEIQYVGEGFWGEHHFQIKRINIDNPNSFELDECVVVVDKHTVIGLENYQEYPSHEEEELMKEILNEQHICHK